MIYTSLSSRVVPIGSIYFDPNMERTFPWTVAEDVYTWGRISGAGAFEPNERGLGYLIKGINSLLFL